MTAILPAETAAGVRHRLQTVAASLTSRYPSRQRPLAPPPNGSDLKPVMGNYGVPSSAT